MDYKHNLEQREIILCRLEELIDEPKIAKDLNELHYLQRLWREEATPVGKAQEKITKEKLEFLSRKIIERKKNYRSGNNTGASGKSSAKEKKSLKR